MIILSIFDINKDAKPFFLKHQAEANRITKHKELQTKMLQKTYTENRQVTYNVNRYKR